MTTTSTPSARPQRGDELELTIDTLAYGGAGVARLDGYVVFVAGALPGDRVRAVIGKRKRAYAEARTLEILARRARPDRAGRRSPGAPWQVLAYDRQLEVKQAQVHDALTRIGKLEGFALEPIVPAVQQWRYRNKLEYSFGTGPDGELQCGFHAPGGGTRSSPSPIACSPPSRPTRAREQIVAWCREQGLAAYDRRTGQGVLRNLVVREGRRSGAIQVRLVTGDAKLDRESLASAGAGLDGLLWTRTDSVAETTQGGGTELLAGADRFDGGDRRDALRDLRQRVLSDEHRDGRAAVRAGDRVRAARRASSALYDLYCGIGTIGLLMSPRVAELWGLELVPEAIADAISNAQANEVDNAHFFAGDVRLALRELVERAGRPDALVVDPPRAGLSQKIVRRVIEASPKRIVYVSCNPTTLAPNAAQLVEAGYR